MNDPVDVLIIGAGASGAAVAWSLADTKMHILCLEQGGWMNPAAYPSAGRDWEARAFGDFSPSPNIRARPEDYPVNDDNSPIKVVNFNGVGGGTVMYTAHFPRLHPSDFRVRSITTDEHGMAAGVVYSDADGIEQFQAAHVVVLACNDVGTPRLLLNSASARFPDGLANSSGLVGKNLMFHPYAQVYGYVEAPTDSNRAPPTCLWSKEFYDTDPSRAFVRGYAIQFGRGAGPVFEAVASEAKGILPWGADHHRVFRKLNGHRMAASAIWQDLAEH